MLKRTQRSTTLVGVVSLLGLGCAALQPAPIVRNQTMRVPDGTMHRIAIMPFDTKATFSEYATETGTSAQNAADLLGRFMSESLMKRGVQVVPPSDMAIALTRRGGKPKLAPPLAAKVAAEEFGATALMVGRVNRYRERAGEKFGSTSGASVAFEVTVYTAPESQRVWTSQFDETQRALGENVWNARRYPGGGTRWLTAAELAQWGVDSSVETLPE